MLYLAVDDRRASTDVDAALPAPAGGRDTDVRVVIAGGGSVGRFIAEQLHGGRSRRHDRRQRPARRRPRRALRRAGGRHVAGGRRLRASARSRRRASSSADVVAAVTGDDEDNLVVSLLAKQEFGVPRVVARVNNPKNEWMFNDLWGVDVAVSTPHLITALVEEAVSVGSFVRLLSFEGGKAKLAEVTLAEGSPADGKADRRARRAPRRHGRGRAARRAPDRAPRRHRCCASATRCSCSSPTSPRSGRPRPARWRRRGTSQAAQGTSV